MSKVFKVARRVWINFICTLLFIAGAAGAHAAEDPLEKINRKIFSFNMQADRWVVKPVATAYSNVTPKPIKRSVTNALENIRDVNYALNALLQGRLKDAATSASRVAINTTAGVAGLLDVASKIGLKKKYADFGQTLASWHVPSGPYVMLPIFGPSSLRDGIGLAADAFALSVQAQLSLEGRLGYLGATTIDSRSGLLNVEPLVTGDRYIFFREAYLQTRALLTAPPAQVNSEDTFLDEIPAWIPD
ncbi:MAG: VacJ family lipoprotein [Pseudomonadota bacterium]